MESEWTRNDNIKHTKTQSRIHSNKTPENTTFKLEIDEMEKKIIFPKKNRRFFKLHSMIVIWNNYHMRHFSTNYIQNLIFLNEKKCVNWNRCNENSITLSHIVQATLTIWVTVWITQFEIFRMMHMWRLSNAMHIQMICSI